MIRLSVELVDAIAAVAERLVGEEPRHSDVITAARAAASALSPISVIANAARALLDEQGFVQIRGLPVPDARRVMLALATLIGEPFIDPAEGSATIPAHVRPGEHLMGNQIRRLPLHTDYSMLDKPPRLTMSCCLRADEIHGFGSVFVSDIEAMCYGLSSDPDVVRFRSVRLPFAARTAGNESPSIIESPIISTGADGGVLVRYHRSRIRQGYATLRSEPTPEQVATMVAFERRSSEVSQELVPQPGDITVIDNHRTVHGRERCSVELRADGSTLGRQMVFLFA